MTFGVLALGCENYKDVTEFLEGLNIFGYKPNAIIMSTLIYKACYKKDFKYLLFVMNYIMKNKIKPNEQAIECLKEFSRNLSKIKEPTVC